MGVYADPSVENTGPVDVNLRSSTNAEIGTSGSPLRIDPTGTTTQPISGTVTATQGSANTTVNAWPIKLTDSGGTNQATINSDGSLSIKNIVQELADANKMFLTTYTKTAIGTSELATVLLRNPNGSGKTLKLYQMTFSNLSGTSGQLVTIKGYAAPTITATGTALTIGCTHVGAATTAVQAFGTPTASANGTQIATWISPSLNNPFTIPLELIVQIGANTDLLLTTTADGTNRSLSMNVIWAEV